MSDQQTGAYKLVTCEICGETFPVWRQVAHSAKYCPECKKLDLYGWAATLARQARKRRLAERDREIERTSPVKVTVEERGGWTVETRGQRCIAPRPFVDVFGVKLRR